MPNSLLHGRRPSVWTVLVPVVALLAGLLFATSGRTAQGTDLRAGETTELSGLIRQRNLVVARQDDQLSELQREVQRLTEQAASRDGAVAAATATGAAGALSAALVQLAGPGVVITWTTPRRGRTAACRWTPVPTTWSSTSPMSRRS